VLRVGWSGDRIPVDGSAYGPWGPPGFLHIGYRIFSREGKRPEPGVDHALASRAEAKDRRELYLYSSSLGLHGLFYGDLYLFVLIVRGLECDIA